MKKPLPRFFQAIFKKGVVKSDNSATLQYLKDRLCGGLGGSLNTG